jgi:hypothetical protein
MLEKLRYVRRVPIETQARTQAKKHAKLTRLEGE